MICCKYCGRRTKRFFDTYCSECSGRLNQGLLQLENHESVAAKLSGNEIAIRIFAVMLALIGSFWGFVLFAIFHSEGNPLRVMMFMSTAGPGYLVTAGYFWRVVARPPYRWRVAIWIASVLVQGTWLVISLVDGRPSPAMMWWFGSCMGSVIAMAMEPKI